MRHYLIGSVAVVALASAAWADPRIETKQKPAAGLYEIVADPAAKQVYVAATGSREAPAAQVVALDAATLAKVRAFDVSASPVFGLAINTRTQTLYGSATRTGAVVAIDLKTGAVTQIKWDGADRAHLREVAVDEATNTIYATELIGGEPRPAGAGQRRAGQGAGGSGQGGPGQAGPAGPGMAGGQEPPAAAAAAAGSEAGSDGPGGRIWVINGATAKVERVIPLPTKTPTGLAIDPRGKRAFVTGMGANEVLAIDLTTDRVAGRWPTGGEGPINVAYDEAGKRLFVANLRSGDLSVLDSTTGAMRAKVATGAGALGVAFNPGNQQVYVANRQAGTLTVVDAKTSAVLANLETGTLPQTIAVNRATNAVYVTNKARGRGRGADPATPAPEDPNGDTVTLVRP